MALIRQRVRRVEGADGSFRQEEVYLKDYRSVAELMTGLTNWFRFYNHERPHQSLKYRTPAEVYQEAGRGSG